MARRAETSSLPGVALLCRRDLPQEIFRHVCPWIDCSVGTANGDISLTGITVEFTRKARDFTHPEESYEYENHRSERIESLMPSTRMTFSGPGYPGVRLTVKGWLAGFETPHTYDRGYGYGIAPETRARMQGPMNKYNRRADIPRTAATWIFRDESWRRRGRDVDIP